MNNELTKQLNLTKV